MGIRFTIARKLFLGFGILGIAFIINTWITFTTLENNQDVNASITEIYEPTAQYLKSMSDMIINSNLLIKNWVFIEQNPVTPDKIKLQELHAHDFPALADSLNKMSILWKSNDMENYNKIKEYKVIITGVRDTLFAYQKMIMEMLNSFEAYEDPFTLLDAEGMVIEGGDVTLYSENIHSRLNNLIDIQAKIVTDKRNKMQNSFTEFKLIIWVMGGILLLGVIITAILTTRSLVRPINFMKKILLQMSKGIIVKDRLKTTNDEIGEMAIAMNQLTKAFRQIAGFAVEVGKGNFESDFEPLSDNDKLGYSLLDMRNNLKEAAKYEENRKKEDQQRAWASNGIAKFSEVLRKNNDDLDALSYDVISNLVKYLDACQGGLFIINDNESKDVHIELKGCYAYDRKKFLQKRIELKEGLIGRCVDEKGIITLTEIPEDYLNITSGLGENKPSFIIICPLIMNDNILGVIEISAFDELEKHKIEFITRLSESIASTLATVKNNMQTNFLLEKTQLQAEEMSSQEEEMRQNMEELQATQEESERREKELVKEIDQIKEELAFYKK